MPQPNRKQMGHRTWWPLVPFLVCFFVACPANDLEESADTIDTADTNDSEWVYEGNCDIDFFADVAYIDDLVEHTVDNPNPVFTFEKALGPPVGAGSANGSLDVFVIGDEGEAVFQKKGYRIIDGDGDDFKVFENGFYSGGDPDANVWDLATVEVSQDGDNWIAIPHTWDTSDGGFTLQNLTGKDNLVGLHPTLANCEDESQSELDLQSEDAGGDGFDLADVGLDWIRYIKIIDSGYTFEDMDAAISNGVDIDSIALFYVESEPDNQ